VGLTAFALAYALSQVPTGWMGTLFGPRRALLAGSFCGSDVHGAHRGDGAAPRTGDVGAGISHRKCAFYSARVRRALFLTYSRAAQLAAAAGARAWPGLGLVCGKLNGQDLRAF